MIMGRRLRGEKGYILPATILLSVAITIVMALYFQVIAGSSRDLNNQSFQSIAQEAALSGVDYAIACVKAGTESWSAPLTQQTKCVDEGVDNSSAMLGVAADGSWRSSFSVSSPQTVTGYTPSARKIVSKGTVERLQGGVPVGAPITVTKVSIFDSTTTILPASTGESATYVKANDHACSINNGRLYCWGENSNGELGIGNNMSQATPQLVGGALTGKYVSQVDVNDANTCAIADGEAYCWGIGTELITPPSNTPVAVGGPLAGKKVTEISLSPTSWQAPQVAPTLRHACALADGAAYCWGGNEYYQMGNTLPCIGFIIKTCPLDNQIPTILNNTPTPVFGHDNKQSTVCGPILPTPAPSPSVCSKDSALYGKKLDRLAAMGHATCSITNGQTYCWGVGPPPGIWGMPKPANIVYPPYLMDGANNLPVDTGSFQASGDAACMMSGWRFNCLGYATAFTGFFSILSAYAFNAPLNIQTGYDVTNHDNGELPIWLVGAVLGGTYCVIQNGVPGCASSLGGAGGTGSYGGFFGETKFSTVLTPAGITGYTGKHPVKIAAAGNYSVMIANGQLFSWGNSATGQLGNGQLASTAMYATKTATGVIGTDEGTYAAESPVSVGGSHGCGVVNGILFCWGGNGNGQLGNGTTMEGVQPTPPKGFDGIPTTKVSAGKDHTCAISIGRLFCWGRNDYGQLGVGNTNSPITVPTLVTASNFNNKRVTDVSAGDDSTCAVADGEAFCWGRNNQNQLGNSAAGSQASTPQSVAGLSGKAVTSISAGATHACAITGGDAYCWGSHANYATGLGTNSGNTAIATKITGGGMGTKSATNELTPMFTQISAGDGFTCAIINSYAYCWGKSASGQTGTGTTSDVMYPTRIAAGSAGANTRQATSISAGKEHACATLQGTTYCWGKRDTGRLGNNDASGTGAQTVPVKTTGATADNNKAITVSAGESSTCSVANGKILCWGNTANHRTGNESPPPVLPEATGILDFVMYQPYQRGPIF